MTKHNFKKIAPYLMAGLLGCLGAQAQAQSTIFGEGRSPVGAGDAAAIRNAAKQDAIRDAVIKGIKDATALDASDPVKYGAIVNEVAKQLRDVKVTEERREGSDFVTRIEVLVDRKQIKNAIRGTELDKLNDRSFSMLMLVDEFLTTTRDLNIPLRELVEFNSDSGSSYSDKSLKASGSSSQSNSAVAASSSVNAATASSTKVNGSSSASLAAQGSDASGSGSLAASRNSNFNGQASNAAAYNSKDSLAASASSKSASASIDQKNVQAKSHDTVSYRKLVEYQDSSKPASNAFFLTPFSGNLRDYDLKLMDAAITRSKFFGDTKITLSALTNGSQMAKFSEFARKANADFLMVGNSTVIEGGKNSLGQMTCVVNADVRAFATAGSELIAASAESMQASGDKIEDCAAAASKKIADKIAPEFANRALSYWADRAARGRQYTVELKSASPLSSAMKDDFAMALSDIKGVADVEPKEETKSSAKFTLTLKGKVNAALLITSAVRAQPSFAGKTLDRNVEGELVTLCLDSCTEAVSAAKPAKDAKKK